MEHFKVYSNRLIKATTYRVVLKMVNFSKILGALELRMKLYNSLIALQSNRSSGEHFKGGDILVTLF